ncbi:MAG: PQQ-binding-like beta-propeller repeat protein [Deltaproteobacteria bacterium]|nr:PQQ-binding-like beta-propeller repeat protein [Deltaproteobacteria bacterium]
MKAYAGFGVFRAAILWGALAAGCASSGSVQDGFGRAGDVGQVASALERSQTNSPGPLNVTGAPLALLVGQSASGPAIVAVDLRANRVLWQTNATVDVRLEVGHTIAAFGDKAGAVVALDIRTGRTAWTHAAPAGAQLLGLATDGQGVYAVYRNVKGAGLLVGWSETGSTKFSVPLDERCGAPAARGGVVAVSQRSQFVSLFNANNGGALADILVRDEAAAFVRGLPEGFAFGSQGVFVASKRTAISSHKGGGYLQAKLPEFVRPVYYYDMYKPAQSRYSAIDRNRLLWRLQGHPETPAFRDDRVIVHNFRFFFAMNANTGNLDWAYSNDRHDAIGAVHAGSSIVFADDEGGVGALDARTGRVLLLTHPAGLPTALQVHGVSFDAEGLTGEGPGARAADALPQVLKSIALHPDKRFNDVRLFAIDQLSHMDDPGVATALLEVLQKGGGEPYLMEKAADSLVERGDARSLPVYIEAIKVKPDYAEGRAPQRLDLMARALAKLGARDAAPALVEHVRLPETDPGTVAEIGEAVIALKARELLAPFRDYLAVYRADPTFMSQPGALIAAANVLVKLGDAQDRTLLLYVAEEPKTITSLKVAIERLLAESSGAPEVAPSAD